MALLALESLEGNTEISLCQWDQSQDREQTNLELDSKIWLSLLNRGGQGSDNGENYWRLHKEIVDIVELHHYVEVEDLVNMAMKVERQLYNKGAVKTYSKSKAKWDATWSKFDEQRNDKVLETPINKDKGTFTHKGTTNSSSFTSNPRHRDLKCFKCQALGHIASECPNKRTMVLRGKEIVSESGDDSIHSSMPSLEDASSDDEDVQYPVKGESLVVRRVLNSNVKEESLEQRENIFHTRCLIMGKMCRMIIDGGSCANFASTTLIDKLGLKCEKHPAPYRLQWLNDSDEVKVIKQVVIAFSIGKYEDEEFDDVFPDEVPTGLPPLRGIEHQIDFVPGASIPNRPAYRSNPEETKELQRQVDDLLAKELF
ncbi:uncharacterized protein G2W53_041455 [Senna tora]|uniref:CCHC-type domain-containing protein n=1 Tax=Senna tora TaxID=362788 RepID=A0A834SF76_9FABA|nr:uncharacterized protein G2W53_041455 [Senna tora]